MLWSRIGSTTARMTPLIRIYRESCRAAAQNRSTWGPSRRLVHRLALRAPWLPLRSFRAASSARSLKLRTPPAFASSLSPTRQRPRLLPARGWWWCSRSLLSCWPRGSRRATRRRAPGRPIVTRSARVGLRLWSRSKQRVRVFRCLIKVRGLHVRLFRDCDKRRQWRRLSDSRGGRLRFVTGFRAKN